MTPPSKDLSPQAQGETTKHTLGPWRASRNSADNGWLIYGPDPEPQYITLIQEYNHPSSRYEQIKADAFLIAAAPEMLDVLSAIVREIDGSATRTARISRKKLSRAKAAIAKAEGGAA